MKDTSNNIKKDTSNKVTKTKVSMLVVIAIVVGVIVLTAAILFINNRNNEEAKKPRLYDINEVTAVPGVSWGANKQTVLKNEKEIKNKSVLKGYDEVAYLVVEDTSIGSFFNLQGTAYYWFELNGDASYLGAYSLLLDDGTEPMSDGRLKRMEEAYSSISKELQKKYGEAYEIKNNNEEDAEEIRFISFVVGSVSMKLTLFQDFDQTYGTPMPYVVFEVSNAKASAPENANVYSENIFSEPQVEYKGTWGILPGMTIEEVKEIMSEFPDVKLELVLEEDGYNRYTITGDVTIADMPAAFVIDADENGVVGMSYLLSYELSEDGIIKSDNDFKIIQSNMMGIYGVRAYKYYGYGDMQYYLVDNPTAEKKYKEGHFSKYDQIVAVDGRNSGYISIVIRQFYNDTDRDESGQAHLDAINGIEFDNKILINVAIFGEADHSNNN